MNEGLREGLSTKVGLLEGLASERDEFALPEWQRYLWEREGIVYVTGTGVIQ